MSRFGRDGRHRGRWDCVTLVVISLLIPTLASGQTTKEATLRVSATDDGEGGRKDYTQISLEELLNKDVTVAATKTRVDVAKAPVSVTVLTPEDIRRSGATNFGELLRTVPGIDVLEAFPSYVSVSARGTSESFVNNMLVLIDGRRFETQLAGVPFLDEAPIRLEDIKRIEVVKGPVGALYGTNALAGVISITTYGAAEVPGTLVSVVGGDRDTLDVTLRHASRIGQGPWAYKVVGGYSYTGTWGSMDEGYALRPISLRKGTGVFLLERRFSDNGLFEAEAGFVKGDLASLTTVTNQTQYFTHPHLRVGYSRPDFHALLTSSPQALELRERVPPIQPLTDRWSLATNLSVDRTLRPFASSTVTVGGNLRHQRSDFTNIATPHSQVVGSLFVQNEQTVVKDHLAVIGAVGLSHHPELDLQVDGNLAVIATPIKDHTFRVSFGRAHRDPSFIESYTYFRRRIGTQDAFQSGNVDLAPESIQAWEIGYRGRVAVGQARVQFFAEGFQEKLRGLIGAAVIQVPAGSLPQFPSATILQQFRNLDARDGRGFEVGAEVETKALQLVGHYSYQDFENAATGAKIVADVPKHKLTGGLRTQKGRVELDLWVHSVSRSINPAVSAVEDGYVLVNPRLGLKAGSWMFSLQAFNSFNDRHLEAVNGRGIRGESVGRLLTFNVRFTP